MSNKIKEKKHLLTFYARQKIEYYLNLGLSKRKIAKKLHKDHSVIIREINRNKDPDGHYYAEEAQRKADLKSKKTNKRKIETNHRLREYIEDKMIKEHWSPEAIAGRIKNYPPSYLKGMNVCHETIYDYIYNGKGKYLHKYLRKAKPKRQKRYNRKKQQKPLILERISIHERSEEINKKSRYGDWESDLILFSKQKLSLSVQYERKAKIIKMHKVENKSALENKWAINKTMEELPDYLRQTITFDNGKENVCHINIRDNFNLETYFCDPYASWQKGGVENANGLIRHYLPRKLNMDTITNEEVYKIQEMINNKPRKSLNYLTPNEVFNKELNKKDP